MSTTPDFVRAKNRRSAVAHMIAKDPILSQLYDEGPNNDGKGGWVNMIRDQHGQAYRLLFYLDRIRLSKKHTDKESYEVIYGEIDPHREEPNFPRALYTTSGAVNLMHDGLPPEPTWRGSFRRSARSVPSRPGSAVSACSGSPIPTSSCSRSRPGSC